MKACYCGTFDPITMGHMDIIERASHLYDEVVVLIMKNDRKTCVFTKDERKQMIEKAVSLLPDKEKIQVMIGEGLTARFAKTIGANVLLRGIRQVSDYEYELLQATTNRYLEKDIETVLMIARPELAFVSSSAVKEIAYNHGEIQGLVPECIYEEVKKKLLTER